ncbi:MAG: helix-turn-helix domain-containing protein [Nitrososphaeria archaeon]
MMEGYLTIEQGAKKYNLSSVSLRKWVRKKLIDAIFENNQWYVNESSLLSFLESRGLNTQPTSDLAVSIQVAELKKENELLKAQLETLNKVIEAKDKEIEFLRAQVQQLTNTVNLLTTRALEAPKETFLDKVRNLFKIG